MFIGIDVSKAQLDVAQRPEGQSLVFSQTPVGIESLVAHVRSLNPSAIVLEATGGLEVPVASALAVAGLPVAVVNPRQVRHADGGDSRVDVGGSRSIPKNCDRLSVKERRTANHPHQ